MYVFMLDYKVIKIIISFFVVVLGEFEHLFLCVYLYLRYGTATSVWSSLKRRQGVGCGCVFGAIITTTTTTTTIAESFIYYY